MIEHNIPWDVARRFLPWARYHRRFSVDGARFEQYRAINRGVASQLTIGFCLRAHPGAASSHAAL